MSALLFQKIFWNQCGWSPVLKQVNLFNLPFMCKGKSLLSEQWNKTPSQCQSVHSNSKRKKVDFPSSVYSHFKALQSCEISEINFEQIMWLSAMPVFYKVFRNLLILEPQTMVSAKKAQGVSGKGALAFSGNPQGFIVNLHLNKLKMLFYFSALSHECHYLQPKKIGNSLDCSTLLLVFGLHFRQYDHLWETKPANWISLHLIQSLVKFKSILWSSVIYKYTIENTNSVLAKQLCCHFCPVRNLWTKETDA